MYTQGWPEPYICTVYERIIGDVSAKNTVNTSYLHGSGHPYVYTYGSGQAHPVMPQVIMYI